MTENRTQFLLGVIILCSSAGATIPAFAAEAFWARAEHGGYFLYNESEQSFQFNLDRTFENLERNPGLGYNFDVEPYTLDRMLEGEKLACETIGREAPSVLHWNLGGKGEDFSAQVSSAAARSGNSGLNLLLRKGSYTNAHYRMRLTNALAGKDLVFSGWIRQRKGQGAQLYIDAYDSENSDSLFVPGSGKKTTQIPADGNWHFVSFTWTVPWNARIAFAQAKCAGGGMTGEVDADFDDLSIRESPDGPELLENPGFEDQAPRSLLDEPRLQRMKGFIDSGRMEVIGGAYSQPFLFAVDSESALRQFLYGTRAVADSLGTKVKTYATQEMGMTGQLPQLLSLFGFSSVVFRTSWGVGGLPPTRDEQSCWWEGTDGSRIATVPGYSVFRSSISNEKEPTKALVDLAQSSGIPNPLFANIHDFVPKSALSSDSANLRGVFSQGWVRVGRTIRETDPLLAQVVGKQIVFSASIRARQPGAQLYVSAEGDAGTLASTQTMTVPADASWHPVRVAFAVPSLTKRLLFLGRINGVENGDADFDLLKLQDAAGNSLISESFETGRGTVFGVLASAGVQSSNEILTGGAADGNQYLQLKLGGLTVHATSVTLSGYFDRLGAPTSTWVDAFSDFEPYFPFGFLAGSVQRADRRTEDRLLRVERLLAITGEPGEQEMQQAWEAHLIGQQHDAWICAAGKSFGFWRQSSYEAVAVAVQDESEAIASRPLVLSRESAPDSGVLALDGAHFTLANPTGFERTGLAKIVIELPPGVAREPRFAHLAGLVPANITVSSRHNDGTAREVHAEVLVTIRPFAMATYSVREASTKETAPELPDVTVVNSPGKIEAENGLVSVEATQPGVTFSAVGATEKFPLRLAGNFQGLGPLESDLYANEVRREGKTTVLTGGGSIGNIPFTNELRIEPYSPLITLDLEFDFGDGTVVGPVEEIPDSGTPTWARDDEKLRLLIPVPFPEPSFLVHNPFEVRPIARARGAVVRYAVAQGDGAGFVVFTDRTTSAVFRREASAAIEVVMANGGVVAYAATGFREMQPLIGKKSFRLVLMPFQSDWQEAEVPKWSELQSQPLAALAIRDRPASSALLLEPENGAVVTAFAPHRDGVMVRLWRPYDGKATLKVKIYRATSISVAGPDGEPSLLLAEGDSAQVSIHKDEIVTLFAPRSLDPQISAGCSCSSGAAGRETAVLAAGIVCLMFRRRRTRVDP